MVSGVEATGSACSTFVVVAQQDVHVKVLVADLVLVEVFPVGVSVRFIWGADTAVVAVDSDGKC